MDKLKEVSEEQIKVLKEMQRNEHINENIIQMSSEIRKWCEFIHKIESL